MTAKTWFQTTAIDYPNSRPHIGTAFEKIGADVQARFRRMEGFDVHFLMGNDENTIKVSQRAAELGVDPKPTATTWPASSGGLAGARDLATTTSSRPARSATTSAARSSSRRCTTPATSTRASTTGCTATAASRSRPRRSRGGRRQVPEPPKTPLLRGRGGELLLPPLGVSATGCSTHYEAHPDFIQPESRRNEIVNLVEIGAAGRRHHAARGSPGASRSRSTPSRRSTSGSTPC